MPPRAIQRCLLGIHRGSLAAATARQSHAEYAAGQSYQQHVLLSTEYSHKACVWADAVTDLSASQSACLVKAGNVHICCQLQLPRVQRGDTLPPQLLQSYHYTEDHHCWHANWHGHGDGAQESEEGSALEAAILALYSDSADVHEEAQNEGKDIDAEDVLHGRHRALYTIQLAC